MKKPKKPAYLTGLHWLLFLLSGALSVLYAVAAAYSHAWQGWVMAIAFFFLCMHWSHRLEHGAK